MIRRRWICCVCSFGQANVSIQNLNCFSSPSSCSFFVSASPFRFALNWMFLFYFLFLFLFLLNFPWFALFTTGNPKSNFILFAMCFVKCDHTHTLVSLCLYLSSRYSRSRAKRTNDNNKNNFFKKSQILNLYFGISILSFGQDILARLETVRFLCS